VDLLQDILRKKAGQKESVDVVVTITCAVTAITGILIGGMVQVGEHYRHALARHGSQRARMDHLPRFGNLLNHTLLEIKGWVQAGKSAEDCLAR